MIAAEDKTAAARTEYNYIQDRNNVLSGTRTYFLFKKREEIVCSNNALITQQEGEAFVHLTKHGLHIVSVEELLICSPLESIAA